jgi:hypothetical protein
MKSVLVPRTCFSYGTIFVDVDVDWSINPDGSVTLVTGESRAIPCEPPTDSPHIGYLRAEFPSECWQFPEVATTVTHSLEQFFAALLPKDPRIEHLYWFSEEDLLKIWIIIPEPDFSLEEPIYDAQVKFMEKTEYACDFSVLYRFGKSIDDIKPQDAHLVF